MRTHVRNFRTIYKKQIRLVLPRITLPGRSSQYNGRKITGLMRRMLARECIPENEGVAGYVEAFRCVLSG